jgi:hypothetical protein
MVRPLKQGKAMSKDWSTAEIIYLAKHYNKIPSQLLAQTLERTRHAVIGKANRLGLSLPWKHTPTRKPYLDEYCHGQGKHQLLLLEDRRSWKEEDSRPRLYVV